MRVFLFTVKYIIFFMICFITLMSFCLSFVSGVSFFLEEEKIIFGQRLLISCAVAIVSFLMAYAIDKYIKISLDDRDMYLIHSGITGITGVILLFPFFSYIVGRGWIFIEMKYWFAYFLGYLIGIWFGHRQWQYFND